MFSLPTGTICLTSEQANTATLACTQGPSQGSFDTLLGTGLGQITWILTCKMGSLGLPL